MIRPFTKVIANQLGYSAANSRGRKLGLIVPEAFVRGIRHIGYRTNVEALAELVDNSIQAYAERIDLVFGCNGEGAARKPEHLAVIDDGHGMAPDMMRFAMMWGGTHRENDRGGLGRFGYGLPCATISMGRRFTIYSKLKRGRLYAVTLDLDVVEAGGYVDAYDEITIPAAQPVMLPPILRNAIRHTHPNGWKSGTIVLVEKLDRLDWITATGLRRNLVRRFGVAYHKLLGATSIHVDGEQVRPIDPLFLEPDADLHSIDQDRARALDPVSIWIEGNEADEHGGEVVIRYAWLPPSFAATDKSRDAIGINANARFPIIKQYHGIIYSRNGRVVDVQSRTPWTIFINNDRYIRIEIEFSAALDEAFGVTTSKQQVSVSPEMWDRLRVAGLHKAIEHLRSKVKAAKAERPARPAGVMHCGGGAILTGNGAPTVQTIVPVSETADPLTLLLDQIERRSANANAAIQAEYRALMDEWATRIGGLPSSSSKRLIQP